MWVFGIILLLISGGIFLLSRSQKKGTAQLRGVERREAGALQELITEISAELGSGTFEETVELVGDVECEEPLVSPLGEEQCVHYDMSVVREFEETYYDSDSDGKKVQRTRTGTDPISSERESCTFDLRDETGSMTVLPENASYDGLISSVSKFEKGERGRLSFGRFTYRVDELPLGKRLVGYRYNEKIIPVDRKLTVVGEASDKMEQVAIRKGDDQFVISTRSREEMVASGRKAAKVLGIVSAVFGVGGVLLVIFGLV